MKKPFVLSGGGARGFGHLGVTKALAERDIYPSEISGTSAGAIAGAFLACGFTPEEIIEMLVGKLSRRMIGWHSFRTGLMSFNKIGDYIESNLRYKTFEELPIPLYITATSFIDGKQKVFSKGNLMDAIIASCAIPAVFPAYTIDGIPYVDGGLSNNLPVEPFRRNKKNVIAVHVNPLWDLREKGGLRAIVERSFHLSVSAITRKSAVGCMMYIEPRQLVDYSLFDLSKSEEIVQVSYDYTVQYLEENLDLLTEYSLFEKMTRDVKHFLKR